MVKRILKIVYLTVKGVFVVACLYIGSLFFCEQPIPAAWVEDALDGWTPSNFVFHVDSVSFGFRHGFHVRNLRLYDRSKRDPLEIVAGVESISYYPFLRHLIVDGAKYPRLPESYYAPGNSERNARLEVELPELGLFKVTFNHPEILALRPESVVADMEITRSRIEFSRIHLLWPDRDDQLTIDGDCAIDFAAQELAGSIKGLAKQAHFRDFLTALDVPVAKPYFEGFTEVPGAVPSGCSWRVDLVNNDFDLDLDLRPAMGRYNGVAMKQARGSVHLRNRIRGESLNYRQTIGPIYAVTAGGRSLFGSVVVEGTNGLNTVEIEAMSTMPIADLLRIGGFTGDYVGNDVIGDSSCRLTFRFPRAMTNNYEVLNGSGHISVSNGQLMRMKGFAGLLEMLAEKVPGFSMITDSTQASCDFVIENGVLKSDNIYIEGSFFSIKMWGEFDARANKMDFTVRVQFSKKDSMVGKVLHPLIWPFTKLLLEFRLTGSPGQPEWDYLSVLDRVIGGS